MRMTDQNSNPKQGFAAPTTPASGPNRLPTRSRPAPILKPNIGFVHPRFGTVTIDFDPKGSPVRHAITHGSRTAAGSFPSTLMGRPMPWESFIERDLIRALEFEWDCRGYLVQPHVMKWVCDGVPHIYYPDAIAEFGRLIVYECKKEHPARHRNGDLKYRMAAEIYRYIGWDFEIVTSAKLSGNPHKQLNHVRLIRNQNVEFDLAHELAVREFITASGGIIMFYSLAESLAKTFRIGAEHAEAIILAMTARRILQFNLERKICPVSPIQLAPPPAGMTILNFWEKANG